MSTKMNAEELAEDRYPAFRTYETYSHRRGYAAAIREVAQPIADQRDELLGIIELLPLDAFKEGGENADAADFVDNARHFVAAMDAARAAIAKATQP